ncbi:MAG: dockerin type I domain-containing protein, partial [Bacteroidota bacterium]
MGEIILRVYAFSSVNGRNDYCNVSVTVESNDDNICADRQGQISGQILTQSGEPMADVEVLNAGLELEFQQTDADGHFSFTGLQEGNDYTIQPYYNFDMLNGVTTLDILLIGRYLLEENDGLTAYQLIAADANRSGAVTILDLIQIRRVILGLDADFDNNTSWRFIPADYFFPNPLDPWEETFPEVANFNNLLGNEFVEFTAIKVGDVDGNARPTTFFGEPNDDNGRSRRETVFLEMDRANSQELLLYSGQQIPTAGLQFTLELSPSATVIPGQIGEGSYRRIENQLLVSFVPRDGESIDPDRPLLSIMGAEVRRLPQLMTNRGALRAEAYGTDFTTYDLGLRLREDELFEAAETGLLEVFPNPFYERARLDFHWPATEAISLRITGPE